MKILIAYDGSVGARRALDWGARLARNSAESSISVISVAPTLEATEPIKDAVDPSSDTGKHRKELEEAAATLAAAGLKADTILRAGNPAEEIIVAAATGGFDLIVIGNHGKSAIERFLMGSVSERVMRHATLPVLIAR